MMLRIHKNARTSSKWLLLYRSVRCGPVVFRGENAVEKFLECLLVEEKRIRPILESVAPMELNALDERSFQRHTVTSVMKN